MNFESENDLLNIDSMKSGLPMEKPMGPMLFEVREAEFRAHAAAEAAAQQRAALPHRGPTALRGHGAHGRCKAL